MATAISSSVSKVSCIFSPLRIPITVMSHSYRYNCFIAKATSPEVAAGAFCTSLNMLKGIQHQIYRFRQGHHEACHGGICPRKRFVLVDLVIKQRNHTAARGYHIPIAVPTISVLPEFRDLATMIFSMIPLAIPIALMG